MLPELQNPCCIAVMREWMTDHKTFLYKNIDLSSLWLERSKLAASVRETETKDLDILRRRTAILTIFRAPLCHCPHPPPPRGGAPGGFRLDLTDLRLTDWLTFNPCDLLPVVDGAVEGQYTTLDLHHQLQFSVTSRTRRVYSLQNTPGVF